MELTPLRSFLAIAREGHLTRAARQLHLSQPAVSAQLSRLEEELGTALFHRSAKGMVLTDAGRTFHAHVEQALVWIEDGREAVEGLRGLQTGTLSIGGGATATTYLLPPLLRQFHARHPGIRLYVREQGSATVVEGVLAGDLDLGVVTLPVDDDAHLRITPWVEDDLRLVVPPGHPLEGRDRFAWADLQNQPLVLFEAGTAVRRVIEAALASAGVTPDIVMELRSIASIQQMVAQGIGAGFVSRFALPGETGGMRPEDGSRALVRELAVLRRADRHPSPATQAFLDVLRVAPPSDATQQRP